MSETILTFLERWRPFSVAISREPHLAGDLLDFVFLHLSHIRLSDQYLLC